MLKIKRAIFRVSLFFLFLILFIFLSAAENLSEISFIVFWAKEGPEIAECLKISIGGILISSAMWIVGNFLIIGKEICNCECEEDDI